jgi:LmbE family N-acetylglucosaminyl deacetylase
MRRILLFTITVAISFATQAQQVRPANAARIYNEIATLQHLTNVLYLAAHPDDENTRLLAWMVNDQHINTAYLSLTRGDGGQNILGSEQGAALGLIRTHELMEARKIDGAGQFFSSAVDFGFSKNPDETFKHWNEYLLTYDVVWVLRKYRPDVIICRFPPTSEAGHGQHSASAILAAKAFKLSGDKLQFTEQLKYYTPWQPRRLLWNTFKFGDRNTTSESQYKVPVGQYSPLLGMGYGELAGISRSIHRSQGAGTPSVPGVQKEYFKLVDGDTLVNSFFDGIDISWNRVGRGDIGDKIGSILMAYDFNHPEASLPALLKLRKEVATVNDPFWRKQKMEEIDKIILDATGFMAELFTRQPQAVAGESINCTLKVISRAGIPVSVAINWDGNGAAEAGTALTNDSLYTIEHPLTVPANQPLTQPYWLEQPTLDAQFVIAHDSLRGFPETPNNLVINLDVKLGDQSFVVPVPVSYKKLDPLKGDVTEQLRIVPAITIEPYASLLITKPNGSLSTSIHLHAFAEVSKARLNIFGDNKELTAIDNISMRANTDTTISIVLAAAQVGKVGKDEFLMDAEVVAGGNSYNKTLKLIQYEHIPTLQYFIPAMAKVIRNDWKATAKKIGFIEGAGDYTVTLLRLAGLQVDILKEADLIDPIRLQQYDAIVTGIRVVNVEKKMAYWMPLLLEYVKQGGTLVMQYNTLQDLSTTNIGPYPLTLSGKRVTEEDAEVGITLPQHRLFNYPNKITAEDFRGWVQERGLYFPVTYDPKYQALFSMHDTGEEALSGATLYATYGKGHYVYTSLSFFRQLPAGNKGAIRLFMNMLSVGK